jgi:virginiamycin B lyase
MRRGNILQLVLASVSVWIVLSGGLIMSLRAQGQTRDKLTQTMPQNVLPVADLQRSVQIDTYHLVSDSGAARGETLYFYKCWMCHNQYTIQAQYGDKAPFLHLKDLFQRSRLATSGQAVTDEAVTAQIKNGSPDMPSFRTDMSDGDIADLVSYLRSGKCCVEGENPPLNPWYRAETKKWPVQSGLSGGARGVVRITSGDSPEGIMVQLIAPNGVRTTVYADRNGRYEFPSMQAGLYTLRIAKPLQYKPFRRDVRIDGPSELDDIVLDRISLSELLPPSAGIESQLSGAELLWNLEGTAAEKQTFNKGCGCHSYQQVFRNRFDERSWRLIVHRMLHYSGAPIVNPSAGGGRANPEEEQRLVAWLVRIRGPESKDQPIMTFPPAHGVGTRLVVTEYELPRVLLSPHDVSGDSKGNIWFTSHKTRYIGKLDPKTGIINEYALPLTPGVLPGTHRVFVDKNDIVWLSENWAHHLTRFDPKTEQFVQMRIETRTPINSPGFGNFAISPDGSVWSAEPGQSQNGAVIKIDPSSGVAKVVGQYPFIGVRGTYDNTISQDGRYWAGGSPAGEGNSIELLDTRTGKMLEANTGARMSTPARGGFDPYGNPWFGGRGGALLELDVKSGLMREYWPPIPDAPFTRFYEAMPDKNGEVWGGVNFGRGFVRLEPKTERWIEYVLPEPFSYDRRTWIDNSTNPVTVWYIDYNGYVVRLQPLE